MTKNRIINTRFWDDNYILELSTIEKLLFIYLFTNSNNNIAGIYEISYKKIALETDIDIKKIKEIIAKFEADKKIVYRHGVIILCNSIKHQSINPSVASGIKTIYDSLNQELQELVLEIWERHEIQKSLKGMDWIIGKDEEKPKNKKIQSELEELFKYLNRLVKGDEKKTLFLPVRQSKLKTRLKTFTPEQLIEAAKNIGENEFLQGDNPQNRRYGTIDYLLRSDEMVASKLEDTKVEAKKSAF